MTWLRRGTVALLSALAVLLLGTSAWAAVEPLPTLGPGQAVVASSWECSEPVVGVPQLCEVRSWAVLPAPAPGPSSQAVTVASLPPVDVSSVAGVVSVRESSPQGPDSVTVTMCSPGSGPSPSAASSTPPASSPTPSPSPGSSGSGSACALTANLAEGQAFGLWLFLGALVLLGVFALVRREGRAFRVG